MNATNRASQPSSRSTVSLWVLLAALAAMGFIYLLMARQAEPTMQSSPVIGQRLLRLELQGLTGDATSISQNDLNGKVTLLNFWGTWCPPCIREFPDIVALAKDFGGRDDFRLYAVSCGGSDESLDELREATTHFLAEQGTTLPTYADQNAETRRSLVAALGVEGFSYPTTLVLDRQGIVRGFWVGYHPGARSEMQKVIASLLDKPADATAAAQPAVSSAALVQQGQ